MIGVRNPQGMALSKNDELIISNHGAKGGDFIGQVESGANYGWNKIGWGGTNYSGTKIGDGSPFKNEYKYPILSWVPSIAPSDLIFYEGEEFPEWKDDILITSSGPVNLSATAPRTWQAIEAKMKEESPLDRFKLPALTN